MRKPQEVVDWLDEFQRSVRWEQETRMHLIDMMKGIESLSCRGQSVDFLASLDVFEVPLMNLYNNTKYFADERTRRSLLSGFGPMEPLVPWLYLREVKRRRVDGGYFIVFDDNFSLPDMFKSRYEGFIHRHERAYIENGEICFPIKPRKLVGDDGYRTLYMDKVRGIKYLDEVPYEAGDNDWIDRFANDCGGKGWPQRLWQVRNTAGLRGSMGYYRPVIESMRKVERAIGYMGARGLRYADVFNLPSKLRDDIDSGELSRRGAFYIATMALIYGLPGYDDLQDIEENADGWGGLFSECCYQMYDGLVLEYGEPRFLK